MPPSATDKRIINKLREDILKMRERWRDTLRIEKCIEKDIGGDKIMLIAKVETSLQLAMRSELAAMQKRVEETAWVDKSLSRTLWLPPLAIDCKKVWTTESQSACITSLSPLSAERLARKLGANLIDVNVQYFVKRPPNMDRWLHSQNRRGERLKFRMNIPEWAACLYGPSGEEPRFNKHKTHSRAFQTRGKFESDSIKIVCEKDGTFLFSAVASRPTFSPSEPRAPDDW